jgi:hypothetical protein
VTPTEPADPEGSRAVEIELKFDVDDDTPLPDWTAVPGVASVSEPDPRELDAVYYDTDDLTLAHAGYAVRRRTGGPDEGWHIKGPRRSDGGRLEQQWPLGDGEGIPDAVRAALASVTDAVNFSPIARIRNSRTAYALLSDAGDWIAEFVDDHVTATDERNDVVRHWREWELELADGAPEDQTAFFAAAEQAVQAVARACWRRAAGPPASCAASWCSQWRRRPSATRSPGSTCASTACSRAGTRRRRSRTRTARRRRRRCA